MVMMVSDDDADDDGDDGDDYDGHTAAVRPCKGPAFCKSNAHKRLKPEPCMPAALPREPNTPGC